jgi:hypothetical protein
MKTGPGGSSPSEFELKIKKEKKKLLQAGEMWAIIDLVQRNRGRQKGFVQRDPNKLVYRGKLPRGRPRKLIVDPTGIFLPTTNYKIKTKRQLRSFLTTSKEKYNFLQSKVLFLSIIIRTILLIYQTLMTTTKISKFDCSILILFINLVKEEQQLVNLQCEFMLKLSLPYYNWFVLLVLFTQIYFKQTTVIAKIISFINTTKLNNNIEQSKIENSPSTLLLNFANEYLLTISKMVNQLWLIDGHMLYKYRFQTYFMTKYFYNFRLFIRLLTYKSDYNTIRFQHKTYKNLLLVDTYIARWCLVKLRRTRKKLFVQNTLLATVLCRSKQIIKLINYFIIDRLIMNNTFTRFSQNDHDNVSTSDRLISIYFYFNKAPQYWIKRQLKPRTLEDINRNPIQWSPGLLERLVEKGMKNYPDYVQSLKEAEEQFRYIWIRDKEINDKLAERFAKFEQEWESGTYRNPYTGKPYIIPDEKDESTL